MFGQIKDMMSLRVELTESLGWKRKKELLYYSTQNISRINVHLSDMIMK